MADFFSWISLGCVFLMSVCHFSVSFYCVISVCHFGVSFQCVSQQCFCCALCHVVLGVKSRSCSQVVASCLDGSSLVSM